MVARVLSRGDIRLMVVSSYADEADFRSLFPSGVVEFMAIPAPGPFPAGYWYVRKLFTGKGISVPSIFRGLWRRLAARMLSVNPLRKSLMAFEPDLVITPTAHKVDDIRLLLAARLLKIPTLSIIASWDNLKYHLGDYPDELLVWNRLMRDEAVRDHGYDSTSATVIGTPYTDFHVGGNNFDREGTLRGLGLDPAKRLIVVATAPKTSVCDHHYLMEAIVEAARAGQLAADCQILCRPHPVEPPDSYARLRSVPEIHWDIAQHSFWDWRFGADDVRHLRDVLKAADVVVNVASTITLEACLHDRPVVNLSYHPDDPDDFHRRVLINHHRSHYRYVLERNGVAMAGSKDQLIAMINAYLKDSSLDHEGRKRISTDLFGPTDGHRAEALAETILARLGMAQSELAVR